VNNTNYVVGFFFSGDKSHVALIRKNRPTWQAGKLNGIGGHIEPGETPIAAQVREFFEETGVVVPVEQWQKVALMYRDGGFRCYVFRAFARYQSFHLDATPLKTTTDETIELHPVNNLPTDILSNVGWLIGMCLDLNPGDFESYKITGTIGKL
jgi:8-oxo-dGTP diphosphatase